MQKYVTRRVLCRILRQLCGTKWNYIDSVKRRYKRNRNKRIKRRHETRLKWMMDTGSTELARLLVSLAIKFGLKHYYVMIPHCSWGYVSIYVPNRLPIPEISVHGTDWRSQEMIPEDFYAM